MAEVAVIQCTTARRMRLKLVLSLTGSAASVNAHLKRSWTALTHARDRYLVLGIIEHGFKRRVCSDVLIVALPGEGEGIGNPGSGIVNRHFQLDRQPTTQLGFVCHTIVRRILT
jgi:hypothetical protein